jgi:hypothetical protein
LLNLLAVEMVLKAHYPIPEIWLRRDDAVTAERDAAELRNAGLAVSVAAAAALTAVPIQVPVEAFTFTDEGLSLALEDHDLILAYDLPIVIVGCTPRDASEVDAPGQAPEVEGSGAWGVFADIYTDDGGQLRRLGVSPHRTAFGSLPGTNLSGPAGKLSRFLAECEVRCRRATIDRRLLHLQTRRLHTPPPPGVQRKGFAFGTPALAGLMREIAPDLPEMNQCELSSRLVYLTQR